LGPPPNPHATGVVLFVGRLVEKKGLNYLIEAMPSILERHPQALLRIVGDGQQKDKILKRVAELGLTESVDYRGAVGNNLLPEIYCSSDVVVFPSVVADDGDREGFGLVLAEALGCGCAAVVTDLPAMRDIVRDGESALIVPQKNAEQLAEKVCRLLEDDELRKSLGEQGRAYVLKKFDWQIIAGQYAELIYRVIR
jgi:glycosyltransferase involved in cell wall biosynthesis